MTSLQIFSLSDCKIQRLLQAKGLHIYSVSSSNKTVHSSLQEILLTVRLLMNLIKISPVQTRIV